MSRLIPAVLSVMLVSVPAFAQQLPSNHLIPPPGVAYANTGSQAVHVGVTGWLQMTPSYTHHLLLNLTVPIVQLPWHAAIETIPTAGTGSLGLGYIFQPSPFTVTPAIGLRYFGATGASTDAFLYGPQAKLSARLKILPWLSLGGEFGCAPWLPALNKGGAGSFADFSASVAANFGRMTYSLGYMGYVVDPANIGFAAFQTPVVGGPMAGVSFVM